MQLVVLVIVHRSGRRDFDTFVLSYRSGLDFVCKTNKRRIILCTQRIKRCANLMNVDMLTSVVSTRQAEKVIDKVVYLDDNKANVKFSKSNESLFEKNNS